MALSGIKEQAYREHAGCVLLNSHSAFADIPNTLLHLAYSLSAKSTCLSLSKLWFDKKDISIPLTIRYLVGEQETFRVLPQIHILHN